MTLMVACKAVGPLGICESFCFLKMMHVRRCWPRSGSLWVRGLCTEQPAGVPAAAGHFKHQIKMPSCFLGSACWLHEAAIISLRCCPDSCMRPSSLCRARLTQLLSVSIISSLHGVRRQIIHVPASLSVYIRLCIKNAKLCWAFILGSLVGDDT